VPVRNLETIARAKVDSGIAEKLIGAERSSLYLYCRETIRAKSSFHARMFAPGMGVTEDPATGSAAAAFAGVIMKYDQPSGGKKNYVIEQGFEIGRPSEVHLEIVVDGGLRIVRIGGHVVKVATGIMEI
jgi:trans-2,3-dihydro-3-hydroxyanthranilate isomerase